MMRWYLILAFVGCSACSRSAESKAPISGADVPQKSFAISDTNGDGFISHSEWAAEETRAAAVIPPVNRKEYIGSLESIFKRFDLNADGRISLKEWLARASRTPR